MLSEMLVWVYLNTTGPRGSGKLSKLKPEGIVKVWMEHDAVLGLQWITSSFWYNESVIIWVGTGICVWLP